MPNLIGTAPDQVPVNGFLGNMAFQNKEGVVVDLLSATALTVSGTIATSLGSAAAPSYTFIGDTNTGIWSPSAAIMAVSTAGAERMRIIANGDMLFSQSSTTIPGLTNTTVGSALLANGAFLTSRDAGAPVFLNRNTTDGQMLSVARGGVQVGGISATTSSVSLVADAGNFLALSAGGSERFRITTTGSVGIGTSSPPAQQTLTAGRNITGSTFSSGVVSSGQVQSDVTTRADYFLSASSVAAGTYPLVIGYQAQQSTFTGTVTAQYGFSADASLIGATSNMGFFGNIPDGTNRWNFYAQGTAPNYFAGNVGIGTTTTSFRLDVRSAGTYTGDLQAALYDTRAMAANVGGGIGFGGNYTGTTVTTWASISGLKENATDGNFAGCLAFYTRPNGSGSIERMRLASNGDVSIGTSSALGGKLNVFGGYVLVQGGAGSAQGVLGSTSTTVDLEAVGANAVRVNTNGAERMRIDSSGNVAIGSTATAAKLNVVQGASGTYGSAGIWVSDNATTSMLMNTISSGVSGMWSSGVLAFGSGSNNFAERMRIDASGKVGIGTASPAGRLDINGNYVGNVVAVAASAIDCSAGNFFIKTATGALTWTVTNVPASRSYSFLLELTNGGTGTQTWFTGIKWPGGTAPTLTASGVDVLGFITDDSGTTWRGVMLMKDSK